MANGFYSKNESYLKKIWRKEFYVWLPILIITVWSLIFDSEYIKFFLPALVIVLVVNFSKKYKVRNEILDLLRSDNPDALLDFKERLFKNVHTPDKDAMLCASKARCLCYYGEIEKADMMMSSMDWAVRAPYIQSFELLHRAFVAYLKEDFREGLRLSLLAKEYAQIPTMVRGAKDALIIYNNYVAIGQLHENFDGNLASRLEEQLSQRSTDDKIFIVFGLYKAYKFAGKTEDAQRLKNQLLSIAPHFKLEVLK